MTLMTLCLIQDFFDKQSGNTERAGVDVFEIVPEVAYPSNYMYCVNYVNIVEIPQNRIKPHSRKRKRVFISLA